METGGERRRQMKQEENVVIHIVYRKYINIHVKKPHETSKIYNHAW